MSARGVAVHTLELNAHLLAVKSVSAGIPVNPSLAKSAATLPVPIADALLARQLAASTVLRL